MSKGLEALEKLKEIIYGRAYNVASECEYEINTIEKALKALEIIKEKRVDVGLFVNCSNVRKYNNAIRFELYNYKLTQEEFDLLKEILK